MESVQLPTFISARRFDILISEGREIPDVNIQCKNCGAMGRSDNWNGILCPSCGQYCGERMN